MCKKNFDGKALSLSSDDETDTIPSDWEEVKPSKKKKSSIKRRQRDKICKTCSQNITSNKKRSSLKFKDKYHQSMAKEYCKDHEFVYSNHTCKPSWCGDCGYLINYEIIVKESRD